MGKISIRAAIPDDINWIMGQLQVFARFLGTKKSIYPSNTQYVHNFLTKMIHEHVLLIADKEGIGSIGLIGGVAVPHFLNPEITVLSELFWWVDEAHRGSRAGLMLLERFNKWASDNTDWVSMSLEEKSPVNEKCLIKRGYAPIERNFLREVH